ncbi:two-component flavin-dependent monooxygenase [Streptomyces sp. 3213]|uniref:hydrolase n=1 Tax=Streptomyces sp. 3213.3 TaxID=1855348 RepID=UPI0008990886|nr:hydrolase [Streptomyces sp. 3213.3]SED92365.1 two-component flavin-dependent monooxygenase [Streptomyces sp. 3213] [Streptomyces sp. 3213.3]
MPDRPSEFTVLTTAAVDVAKLAAEHAAEAEHRRSLPEAVVESLISAGFARHFAPVAHGGRAGRFTDVVTAVATVGAGCTSAAWGASLTAHLPRMAAYLPEQGQADIWQDGPDTLVVGALMPLGRAEPTPGGWRVSGRWPYVSLVEFSEWALVCAVTPAGTTAETRFFAVPRDAYAFEDSWDSVGMRGTGSHTLVMDDVLVPAHRSFLRDTVVTGAAWDGASPCHRVPLKAVNGLCFAAPVLGAARAAADAWRALASGRGSLTDAAAADLARATGETDAAELLLLRAATTADHGTVDAMEVARAARDCALAADLSVTAVERLLRGAGTRGQQQGSPLQRAWRDVHSAASHVVLQFQPAAVEYARQLTA